VSEANAVRVFVNGTAVNAPAGGTALDALALADPAEAEAVASGSRIITDSRGIAVPAATPVFAGAIFRTVRSQTVRAPTAPG
jgi:hypothetical protein